MSYARSELVEEIAKNLGKLVEGEALSNGDKLRVDNYAEVYSWQFQDRTSAHRAAMLNDAVASMARDWKTA